MKTFKEFLTLQREVRERHIDDIEEKLSGLDPDELPFDDMFQGKYRFVIPFGDKEIITLKQLIKDRYNSENFPGLIDYDINWIDGQIEAKYENPRAGQKVIDKKTRKETIVPDYGTKKIKISKFLSNVKPDMLNWWSSFMDTDAMTAQTRESMAKDAGKYQILVSRHPVDIMRMSDHDAWSSCHSPPEKGFGVNYFQCAKQESVDGGGVAYLVKSDELEGVDLDDDEIMPDDDRGVEGQIEPKGRIRIRRFTSKFPDEKTGEEFDFAVPETSMYGTRATGFKDALVDWFRKNQADIVERNGGRTQFRKDNFVMRGGSYRDTSDGALFNNFFQDNLDHGNTAHSFQGEESLVDISEQYEAELEEMKETWNNQWKHCWADYDSDSYFDMDGFYYSISGGCNVTIPKSFPMLEEPDEQDITGGYHWDKDSGDKQSLKDHLDDHGFYVSSEGANVYTDNNGELEISLYVEEDENQHYGDDGRHPDQFDEYCNELNSNFEEEYEKLFGVVKEWLILNGHAETPPARELEDKLWGVEDHPPEIPLQNFVLMDRDDDELGIVYITAQTKLPITTSTRLGDPNKYGHRELKNQVDERKMAMMIDQIKRAFLGSLNADARHYDRQQWLPFPDMQKPDNPYVVGHEGLPEIKVDGDHQGVIRIEASFVLKDDMSQEEVDNTQRYLLTLDRNWGGLVQRAQQIIQQTLWDREEEEIQSAQAANDQEKLSRLLSGRPKRPQLPQQGPRLFQEPDTRTPEQKKNDDLRDRILKRGKYAPNQGESS
tara:strand:+ start:20617 stop:22932 length:2316 start_codon:yes stop_codon:yes gene_type:complete